MQTYYSLNSLSKNARWRPATQQNKEEEEDFKMAYDLEIEGDAERLHEASGKFWINLQQWRN